MYGPDGTKPSDKAVEVAAKFADISDSELTVITVIESDAGREQPAYNEYGDKENKHVLWGLGTG